MTDQLNPTLPTAATDLELDAVRAALAWLVSAGAGDLTAEFAAYVAELGSVAARQQLLECTAPGRRGRSARRRPRPADTLAAGERIGARLVIPEDAQWPATLHAENVLAPVVLWAQLQRRELTRGQPLQAASASLPQGHRFASS